MDFNEHNYICRECGGRKIVPAHSIISRVCPICNGQGRQDWITHAMGGRIPYEPPDHQFLHNLVMRNIQILVNEIRIQVLELGASADVSVEFKSRAGYGPNMNLHEFDNKVFKAMSL